MEAPQQTDCSKPLRPDYAGIPTAANVRIAKVAADLRHKFPKMTDQEAHNLSQLLYRKLRQSRKVGRPRSERITRAIEWKKARGSFVGFLASEHPDYNSWSPERRRDESRKLRDAAASRERREKRKGRQKRRLVRQRDK